MARSSSILVRLSGRKHERRSSAPNVGVKEAPQENSWQRRSLASLSRKLRPGLKPPHPLSAADGTDLTRDVHNNSDPEPQPTLYTRPVELIRQEEYPHMSTGTYLDHSGTTIYARSTLTRTTALLLTNLYGNPHSANSPAALSGEQVDAVREKALAFLGADPRYFDLVFTANATAAIKLVAEAFRDVAGGGNSSIGGFWYGYHVEGHTSLVGVRELAAPDSAGGRRLFTSDGEVEEWLNTGDGGHGSGAREAASLGLFAYPGQSNLTGRRLPLGWAGRVRRRERKGRPGVGCASVYTLLDAAALAMTSPMAAVFANPDAAPDFVCVSFYKIFGFPDLGGLVVRRDSGHILALRKYFGGGTVAMVSVVGEAWHLSRGLERKAGNAAGEGPAGAPLHETLEDGTLPFHSILALGEAIDVHAELYGSMENISSHTTALVRRLYRGMKELKYANGQPLCKVYGDEDGGSAFGDARRQGGTVAFNVFRGDGGYESYATVEQLANDSGIYVRSGGICCPGGLFTALQYEPWQLQRVRSAGHRCGADGLGLINELPTGVVRASLGAMSTVQDVDKVLTFLHEAFIAREDCAYGSGNSDGSARSVDSEHVGEFSIEQREGRPQVAGYRLA